MILYKQAIIWSLQANMYVILSIAFNGSLQLGTIHILRHHKILILSPQTNYVLLFALWLLYVPIRSLQRALMNLKSECKFSVVPDKQLLSIVQGPLQRSLNCTTFKFNPLQDFFVLYTLHEFTVQINKNLRRH